MINAPPRKQVPIEIRWVVFWIVRRVSGLMSTSENWIRQSRSTDHLHQPVVALDQLLEPEDVARPDQRADHEREPELLPAEHPIRPALALASLVGDSLGIAVDTPNGRRAAHPPIEMMPAQLCLTTA
jgi:hypothetical protein